MPDRLAEIVADAAARLEAAGEAVTPEAVAATAAWVDQRLLDLDPAVGAPSRRRRLPGRTRAVVSVGDGVVAGLTDAVFLPQAREDGATGTLRCPSGRRLAVDDVPAIVTAALVVLRDNLDAIPTVVARVPQPAMMMGTLIANDELAALGAPRVAVPADGEPKAAAEALRSALVELSARGWTHHDE